LRAAISSRGLARNWLARRDLNAYRNAASFLQETAIAAAIQAVLSRILRELWTAGWQLGRTSAAELLGEHEAEADEAELEQLLAQGDGRIPGMVETRVRQVEAILDGAGPDAMPEDLESDLEDELGSDWRALAVTQTETTWSMAEGMLGWYYQAGVSTVGWLTAEDERVCVECDANESEGLIPAGEVFYSGDTQPPAHAMCRCCLMPGDILGAPLPVSLYN
jgi:hypothetical protein